MRPTTLMLIPPSPVSDKITASIRGAVWNRTDAEKTYQAVVPAHSARGICFDWPTKGHAGQHEIIFTLRNDDVHRMLQPLKVIASDTRSIDLINDTSIPLYKDPAQPVEKRVDDLLRRMTLQEKVDLVGGTGFQTKENTRLGIPAILMTDGPLGPNVNGPSTNYSATINMAATFDTDLIRRVAENLGEETRIKGRNMLLAPMINIIRTPFGGRAFELFSEDPYLTSRMAVAYVKGVQSKRVITCTKVMTANNQEWNRFDVNVKVGERALREIYLPAIKAAVQEADTWSIMAAYNKVNGEWCCENKYLLTDILKKEWGFTGFVVTDWGGARSTVKMANSGLDLEMPTDKYYGEKLLKAIQNGQVKESTLDDKVGRLLRVMFKAGLFDESSGNYGGVSDTPERRALALETAQKSIVLLKNESHFLPLHRDKIKSIAVIGPNGDVARMKGAGSGALDGHYGVSPLQGIREKVGSKVTVRFERGFQKERLELPVAPEDDYVLPDGRPGIYAEYFNNRDLEGEPVLTRIEKAVNFDWGYGGGRDDGWGVGRDRNAVPPGSPQPGVINLDKWSARWTGKLKSPGNGWYDIGVQSDNGVRLYLDGRKILDYWIDSKPGKFKIVPYKFQAGRLYDLKIEFYENIGSSLCKFGFAPRDTSENLQNAVQLAKESDIVVLCVGLNEGMEGEAIDRDQLELPENQLKLIDQVTDANKNTVVVLNNGTPILMNGWIVKVPALIEAFYPGQEGGHALADILFGDVNPSGKLPLTFPKRWQDSPAYGTYPGTKELADYREGIYVGYRYFDKQNIEPLFPFGHGLSYTTFEYSDLRISPPRVTADDTVRVQLAVKNTGDMAGDEVVQLYVQDMKASVDREVKALKGMTRVSLKPGETKAVTFKLDKSHLSFYDVKTRRWIAEPGEFKVLCGSSSRDIRSEGHFLMKDQ
ncbi:MAG: beta-glucosidase [Calditrichaeota bacterium]|nr:beta-glucosidase [Calditrichota bacterium]